MHSPQLLDIWLKHPHLSIGQTAPTSKERVVKMRLGSVQECASNSYKMLLRYNAHIRVQKNHAACPPAQDWLSDVRREPNCECGCG